MKKSALFVCLGNICRSPMAEAVFLHMLSDRGVAADWHVDSAALGDWNLGRAPDNRAQATMQKYNIPMNCRARLVRNSDFSEFDYIFGMDDENISELEDLAPADSRARVILLGTHDPQGERIIRDPYFDNGDAGFEKCYQQCVRCCNAFLDSIYKK